MVQTVARACPASTRGSECTFARKRALRIDGGPTCSRSAASVPDRLESKQRLHDLSP
jgi:hypothetical protein